MSNTPAQQFQAIFDAARAEPYVLGLFLGGSRGKGFENECSDYGASRARYFNHTRPHPRPIPKHKLHARQRRQSPFKLGAIERGADDMHIRAGVDREVGI